MGATGELGLSSGPEKYLERRDSMISDALFVAADLADAPYGAAPVMRWQDVREAGALTPDVGHTRHWILRI
ncbi:hypothetical protein [Streptomyces sp. NPDC001665]